VLVSWNFKHIVNLRRIHAFNAVNLKQEYPVLEIRNPREVIGDEWWALTFKHASWKAGGQYHLCGESTPRYHHPVLLLLFGMT